ncbi:MAG TPA: GyrI-like domain-containing protein [Puia sp.]|nr:GyrI-like domain-containing protein [Puia sp.]
MEIEIINNNYLQQIHGFSGIAVNKEYMRTAFGLMDKMWETIEAEKLTHKGLNIWVYEPDEKIFAGVELNQTDNQDTNLEQKTINLIKYAYYKHIGPYHQLKKVGQEMRDELKTKGFTTIFPYIEIYGHWTNDETKLETELLICIE